MKLSNPVTAILIGILATLQPTVCEAQSKKWHPGRVTFKNGEELSGNLYYKIEKEELLLRHDDSTRVFRPRDIYSFEVETKDSLEIFYSLPFDLHEENSPPVFFQLLKELPDFWLLLRRTLLETTSGSSPTTMRTVTGPVEMIFFLTNEGQVKLFCSQDNPNSRR
jgi:hypothetical protein